MVRAKFMHWSTLSTGIDVSGSSPGHTIEVTGFSGPFDAQFQVSPRVQSDITVLP